MLTPAGENKRNEQRKAEIRETDTEQQKANAHKEKRGQRGRETNSIRENIDKGKDNGRQNDRERKTQQGTWANRLRNKEVGRETS